jgi:hypothetical protein
MQSFQVHASHAVTASGIPDFSTKVCWIRSSLLLFLNPAVAKSVKIWT